jgi:hypothetical protein
VVTWYADRDDRYHTLRSGGWLVAAFLLPVLIAICAAGASVVVLFAAIPLPLAVLAVIWEFVRDRRAVVELRLTAAEVTVLRVNGSTTTYPLTALRTVEVTRTGTSARMRLFVAGTVERTRSGPAWIEALTAAEVDLRIRDRVDPD